MRYVYIVLAGLVIGANICASEMWLCSEDSSQIQGSQILACGIGEGPTESIARKEAFKNAKEEFTSICDTQTLCGEHKYHAAPSRSTCEKKDDGWKCYRLIVYGIESDRRTAQNPAVFTTYNNSVRDEGMDLMDSLINKELKKQLSQ